MDWNIIESTMPFVPLPESSLNFLYNYNNNNPYSGMEMSRAALGQAQQNSSLPAKDEMNIINDGNNYGVKKRKLTSNQVDSLERSFREEMKLEPERKMKLSIELGLQPRQIAVWFQNRRTRWKTKQLEHLYDELKQEHQKLQEEVMELKEKLKEQDNIRTQTFREEPVESTLETLRWREIEGGFHDPCSNKPQETTSSIQQVGEGYNNNSSFIYEDFDSVLMLHECRWPELPY